MAANGSLKRRPFHHLPTQDVRNSVNLARPERLCGWEISQLVLLHDDIGIVEWVNDAERQIFPVASKTEWCRSLFGRVPSRTMDKSRLQTALSLLEICLEWNKYYIHEMMPSLTENKTDKDIREIRQHLVTNKPGHFPLKLGGTESPMPYRTVEGRVRRSNEYSKPAANPISKIYNLERRLAARRKAKIDKGMEGLRQPLITKTRLCQRKIFNPSVISVMREASPQTPVEDTQETRKTLYKKYLQLLPIDRALQIAKHSKTTSLPPLRENLAPVPKVANSKHLQYRTVSSRAISQKAFHSAFKPPEFLVQQTKESLLVKENLHKLHGDVEPRQGMAVKTNIVVSRPCSTELVSETP